MKNLSDKGLSMSQASSISNLCNQRAMEIEGDLSYFNNCSKTVKVDGDDLIAQAGRPLPDNIVELVLEKGRLHATQGFLMENIHAKESMLKAKQKEAFQHELVAPKYPELTVAKVVPQVKEDWGWSQLTVTEMAEYVEAEAQAAHIGKFIHKGSMLDRLRKELPSIQTLEWMTTPGEKSKALPMKVNIHHTSKGLLEIHEELAAAHRKFEQKVNYFKAKVKNLVTEENARISKLNAEEQSTVTKTNTELLNQYKADYKLFSEEVSKLEFEFEAKRQEEIKRIAALRIDVHPIFQPLITEFLNKLEDKK